MTQRALAFLLLLLPACVLSAADPLPSDDPQGVEFFERKIRPVLVQHCYECHSRESTTLQGGLLLDSREGLLAGGDSGAAIVPGKPDESPLLSALRYDGFEMPPSGRLPEDTIADFEEWIRRGAPDPRVGDPAPTRPTGIDIEAGRSHWTYQLPVRHPQPDVAAAEWPANEIDRFVLSRLEAAGVRPTRDADRVTLVRRLYFDLIGLPPTPEQIRDFVNDPAPDAYERLVDRLLASPHFGERWGRHWLDVVRFAESITLRGFVLPEAWRYRDYVIDSFNDDRPFDRFLTEQLAGDLLDDESLEARQRNLVATTFLMLGNTNLEEQDKKQLEMDFIDEQLDVVSRGFLAQTVTCARCHDHKFDPIPTDDYYALAGILKNVKAIEHANVSKWVEVPLPVSDELETQLRAQESAAAAAETRVAELRKQVNLLGGGSSADGKIVPADELPGFVIDDLDARRVGAWIHSNSVRSYISSGYSHDGDKNKGEASLTFIPRLPRDGVYEVRFAYTPGTNRASNVPVTVFSADGEKTSTIDEKQPPPLDGHFILLGRFRFEVDGQSFVIVSTEGTDGHVVADAVQFLPVEQVDLAAGPSADADAKNSELAVLKRELADAEASLKALRSSGPKRPMVMSVVENDVTEDLPIHVRGSVHNLGDIMPRGFLQVATAGTQQPLPIDESGRRQLAEWIASPQNPLTARVFANRVWHWLFGAGLVRTVDNFGTTGEMPSHPELLDNLALDFIEDGWSAKKLVRRIVLSRTYRLASSADERLLAADPENRLFGRANLRRLEAECLRDAMLAASGMLDRAFGGRTFKESLATDYGFEHTSTRRSIYVPVFRNSLPELFEAFDFANPSMVTGERNVSTVAPQALFLMNHPFVMEQSKQTAEHLLQEAVDDEARVTRAYELVLGRHPSEQERQLAMEFLSTSHSADDAWSQFVHSLFASIDMRYLR